MLYDPLFDPLYDALYDDLTDRTDGPLTSFVLISRACGLVAKGSNPDAVANALHDALSEYGFLVKAKPVPSLERC